MAQTRAEHLIEQGRELERTQAKRDSVLTALRLRFESLPEAVVSEISAIEDIARLDTIFEQAVTAERLDTLSLACFERYSQRMS